MDDQSLKYLPGIDWFERYKTKNMCYMLNECPSLISTQNIYKYTVFLEIIGVISRNTVILQVLYLMIVNQ